MTARKLRTATLTLMAAIAATVAVAGCGGESNGGEEEKSSGPGMHKKETGKNPGY